MKINKTGLIVLLLSLGLTIVPISLNLNQNSSDNNYNHITVLPEVFEEEDTIPPIDDISLPDQENDPTSDLPSKSQIDSKEEEEENTDPEEDDDIPTQTKPSVKAIIEIKPDTLCFRSRGKWIRIFVELPDGYDILDINITSILLNDTIAPNYNSTKYGDYDDDGIPDLRLLFNRSEITDFLQDQEGDNVELTIEGKIDEKISFRGSDTVKLVHFNAHREYYGFICHRRNRNHHRH